MTYSSHMVSLLRVGSNVLTCSGVQVTYEGVIVGFSVESCRGGMITYGDKYGDK